MAKETWKICGTRAKILWKDVIGGGILGNLYQMLEAESKFRGSDQILNQILNGRGRGDMDKFYRELATAFTKRLQPRYPDADDSAIEDTVYRHLLQGHPACITSALAALPPCASEILPRLPSERPADDAFAHVPSQTSKASVLARPPGIDLWTPGPDAAAIAQAFGSSIAPDAVRRIAELSSHAISAIASGDFGRQLEIAQHTLDLARQTKSSRLLGEAEYLRGESLRLLADFARDERKARQLREEAGAAYDNAAVSLGSDPRPIRGAARVQEVLGRLEDAFEGFQSAEALAAFHFRSASSLDSNSLAHESIRSMRHKFYCAAELKKQSPFSSLPTALPRDEFESLILRSEREHRLVLARFRLSPHWWGIEWFMAQVIHAKGWLALEQFAAAAKRLLWALEMRLRLIPAEGQLNDVEIGNLMWWLRTAKEAEVGFDRDQRPALEAMGTVLANITTAVQRHSIHAAGASLLNSNSAPWHRT